jgi:hypothetical protein
MSGGNFDNIQFIIPNVVDELEEILERLNGDSNFGYTLSDETLREFKIAIKLLKQTCVYVNEIDYLICGDTSEESFHIRLNDELEKIEKEHT